MSFDTKINTVLSEMPHMFWYDKSKDIILEIPGTDMTLRHGIDFRLERWASIEDKVRLWSALMFGQGVVGRTKQDVWVLFRIEDRKDPTMRIATLDEIQELERLPDGWEDNIAVDSWGE